MTPRPRLRSAAIYVVGLAVTVAAWIGWTGREGVPVADARPVPEDYLVDLAAHRLLTRFAERGATIRPEARLLHERRLARAFPAAATPPALASVPGPVLQLTMSPPDRDDPRAGIDAHPANRGLAWERPGVAELRRDGELVLRSRVGVRIHGSTESRESGEEDGLGYRLYFREAYDPEPPPAAALWTQADGPLRRVVVYKDADPRLVLGFDLSRRLGLPAPYATWARIFLDGEDLGVRLLLEHVGDDLLRSRYGPAQFASFRFKEDEGNPVREEYLDAMRSWYAAGEWGLDEVFATIDEDALLAQFVLHLLIEDYDGFQGLVFRDARDSRSKWRFVTWDTEGAFGAEWARELYYRERPDQVEDFAEHLGVWSVQSHVWRELHDTADFRRRVGPAILDALDHRITDDWLDAQFRAYEGEIASLGLPRAVPVAELREFLRVRRREVRALVEEQWASGPSVPSAPTPAVDASHP